METMNTKELANLKAGHPLRLLWTNCGRMPASVFFRSVYDGNKGTVLVVDSDGRSFLVSAADLAVVS